MRNYSRIFILLLLYIFFSNCFLMLLKAQEITNGKKYWFALPYAKMLQYSTSIILVTFKDDADMVEELTECVDQLCEIVGLLGIGNMDEAERLNIELVKKIKNHVDCQSTT